MSYTVNDLYYSEGFFTYLINNKPYDGFNLQRGSGYDASDVFKNDELVPSFTIDGNGSQILAVNFESRSAPNVDGSYYKYYNYMLYQQQNGTFVELLPRNNSYLGAAIINILKIPHPNGKIDPWGQFDELLLTPIDQDVIDFIERSFEESPITDFDDALGRLNIAFK